ncbi:cyclophilin-like protein [Pleomassaria siparia CBS 279.74]|uniref:Cyclophilin-like protein n=1 Tax=Pleomassaria siparia CBS 279.74 TaxID=1314801 RepID=A0A6G1KRJ0_9PLEO|nr:cyclophilin-like protein [Pleomassaria siparia CBS 279.74]
MSAVYNLEPNPTAKVLLQTTTGDLEIELFAKQTPITSRNFLQLCLDGYYDNTVFHRLVKGFILQGGDPTGTGQGGESSYDGEVFVDEFHSRLKFNRRGLLGMANTGKKDDNGSQFFFTLGGTPELQGKNTLFGRIAGDTIYNLMKIAEADTAESDAERPLYPTRITGTEIIINPFEDMVKRNRTAQRTEVEAKKTKKPKRKAGKTLLSFGEDGREEAVAMPVFKKAKYNTKLVSTGEEAKSIPKDAPLPDTSTMERAIPIRKPMRKSPSRSRSRSLEPAPKSAPKSQPRQRMPTPPPKELSPESEKQSKLDKVNAQIAALKASMKRNTTTQTAESVKKKSLLESMVPANTTKGRKRGANNAASEQATLAILSKFKIKLETAPAVPTKDVPALPRSTADMSDIEEPTDGNKSALMEREAVPCDLHFIVGCQSCSKWNEELQDDSDDDTGWMGHALSFAKDRLGKDLEWKRKNEDELVVIDPLEVARELKDERKSKKREWDVPNGKGKKKTIGSAGR